MDKANALLDNTFNLEYEKRRNYPADFEKYRRLWYYVGKTHKVLEFPIHLDLEVSNTCNLQCKMCMRRSIKWKTHDYMNFQDWCKYINEGLRYSTFYSIKPNYRCEPTMHKQLPMFIEWAKERGVMDILMNTNGKYPIPLIYQIGPHLSELAFSIDATTKPVYDKVRPGGNFDSLILNVKNALHLRKLYPNLRVRVAFVKQKQNIQQANDFIGYWRKQRVDKIAVSNAYNPAQRGEYQGAVRWEPNLNWVCPQIFQRLVVAHDGKILPCCGGWTEEYVLGNIKKDGLTLHDFWHSDKMTKLREIHKAHRYQEIPMCRDCALSKRIVIE